MKDVTSSRSSKQRPFAARYLRYKRHGKRMLLIVKTVLGLGLQFIGHIGSVLIIVGSVFIILMFFYEIFHHQTEIQPISVPRSLEQEGYTSEVAARRLKDALNHLSDKASSAGAGKWAVSMRSEAPEIVVPTIGLSLSTVATYVESLPRSFATSHHRRRVHQVGQGPDPRAAPRRPNRLSFGKPRPGRSVGRGLEGRRGGLDASS